MISLKNLKALNEVKYIEVKDIGLWLPWLKKNERKLKGKVVEGPATIKLPLEPGMTEDSELEEADEGSRSEGRMDKLVSYLKKRSRSAGAIVHKTIESYPWSEAGYGRLRNPSEYDHYEARIPLKHIKRTQESVVPHHTLLYAKDMAQGKFDETEDRAKIHLLKKGDEYLIINGHHRLLAAQLNRKRDILAKVSVKK